MNSPPLKNPALEKSLAVVGFGDLATRLSSELAADGWQISGLRRSAAACSGVRMVRGDASDKAAVAALLEGKPEQLLVSLTPDDRDEAGYRHAYLDTLETLLGVCRTYDARPHLIFVSSTAVYGEDRGARVSEETSTEPVRFNGRVLYEAESMLRASALPQTIVRFSGIYGRRETSLVNQLRSTRPSFRPRHWTNRIHVLDCIGVLRFALQSYRDSRKGLDRILASDLRPAQEGAMENWIRVQLGMPRLSYGRTAHSGKRCDSAKLQSLGYRFRVPDFRTGYRLGL